MSMINNNSKNNNNNSNNNNNNNNNNDNHNKHNNNSHNIKLKIHSHYKKCIFIVKSAINIQVIHIQRK